VTATVDRSRADHVVTILNEAFAAGQGLLAERQDLVENQIPAGVEPLSRAHALFLFYTIPQDHGVKSRNLYDRAKGLFEEQPQLFEPDMVTSQFDSPDDPRIVDLITRRLGTRYPSNAARGWFKNSVRLLEEFDGDARNLFSVSSQARAVMNALTSFVGFGPKTAGMFLVRRSGLASQKSQGCTKSWFPSTSMIVESRL
jgi:hypothetical protein